MADLILDGTSIISKTGSNNPAITSGLDFPAGHIIQIGYAQKTDVQPTTANYASGSWDDVTGLSVALTPSSATNYLLCQAHCHGGNSSATYGFAFRLYISGGGTDGAICVGDSSQGSNAPASAGGPSGAGHESQSFAFNTRIRCNDSTPNWSSGALTVKVQFATNGTGTGRINVAGSGANNSGYTYTMSSLTIYEVQG
jgi:hypothetical protein